MPSANLLEEFALAAQASYAQFNGQTANQALVQPGFGDMPDAAAQRFLGSAGLAPGITLLNHTPNSLNGFSASLFQDRATSGFVLAIRGTDDLADKLQDIKLGVVGFANDQLISLYRYYRQLTTPGGESVQYTPEEI